MPTTPYTLRRIRRSKNVRITIKQDGSVLVTAPMRTPVYFIKKFIEEKEDWINTQVDKFKQMPVSPLDKLGKDDYKKYKHQALELVRDRISYWSKIYGFQFGKVNVRDQKTRWGSCARNGNINFNYKILFLPERLRDYIIVHEICHLKEFNHSQRFWNLVSKTLPDYKELRKELVKGNIELQ